jgi:uncharacterized iron-regulated membrane protein
MLRKFLFWSHLVVGIITGIIVFIMSATGVLLTYEKQIIEWDEKRYSVVAQQGDKKLTTDEVLNIARQKHPDENHIYIHWFNEEKRAIPIWAGEYRYLLSPYSGQVLQTGQSPIVESLHFVTDLHRWLAMELEEESFAKEVTAYSNLFFLFLIVSGAYIWIPRRMRWSSLKPRFFFKKQFKNVHAKYFNWHHVFGFWAILPLFIIVATATIFHFKWANEIIYGIYGEEIPALSKRPEPVKLLDGKQSYESLFNVAKQHAANNGAEDWHSMWVEFGREKGNTRFYIDPSLGNNHAVAYALYLDNDTAEVVKVKRGSDWSKGSQAWDVARFLHTGEYFGIIGQTIAGLASLAACFLVYTGFLLSWRRLVSPYLSRSGQAAELNVLPKKVLRKLQSNHRETIE